MKTLLLKPASLSTLKVTEDTQFLLDLSGISDSRYTVELFLEKQGVSAEIYGFYSLKGTQKLSLTTIARHMAPNTSCLTSIKGVLDESASSTYIGKILIDKTAQQTSSFLSHNVLVVGNKTSNTSQPILEIEADDVRASHGATTGRIDEAQLYYLATRGLSRDLAMNMIIQGFFDSALTKISDQKLAESVSQTLYKEV